MRIHRNVITAVFQRNFLSYFSNPIGYLFMTAFMVASGFYLYWHKNIFFTNNLADLEPLNEYYPYLLLFFVPGISMTVWADERKSGTDELLLTLPATDFEIVLGKYLSCLGIYTITLVYSMVCNLMILAFLGNPDHGLFLATYFGYWLIGAGLLAGGMMASLFSANVTIAFIWGVVVCLGLVFLGEIAVWTSARLVRFFQPIPGLREVAGWLFGTDTFYREFVETAGAVTQFEPFSKGLVSIGGLLYFASVIVVMLYLNVFLLGRRHWAGSVTAPSHWTHHLVRAVSIALAAVSLTILVERASGMAEWTTAVTQLDLTQEGIHTLSPDTQRILVGIDPQRPVVIEAFLSPQVPKEYVETRRNLVDLLRRFDAIGGNRLEVRIQEPRLFTDEARQAERVYEIKPETVTSVEDGRVSQEDIFLGLAFKCGSKEKTIPFFYPGLSVEYEITRMIQTVSEKARRKVGILSTDAALFGQFNFQTFQPGRDWMIVSELRQQYDVQQVSPDGDIDPGLDVLVVPMASSLSQTQLDKLIDHVRAGKATLIFDDPMPLFVNPDLAAQAPRQRSQPNMMMGMNQPPPTPKGNVRDLLNVLGIDFDASNVVWQDWQSHPQFEDLPEEYVFIGASRQDGRAFNPSSEITRGLQEVILIYPGGLRERGGDGPEFTPLLRTSDRSGTTPWNRIFDDGGFMGFRALNPNPPRRQTDSEYVLAAHIHGPLADAAVSRKPPFDLDRDEDEEEHEDEADAQKPEEKKGDQPADKAAGSQVNVIFIADLDMIADQFFQLRRQGDEKLTFDNVSFVLNCVDVLAGDASFIELRKKRPGRRTLELVHDMTKDVAIEAQKRKQEAEEAAQKKLDEAEADLRKGAQEIEKRTDLSPTQKKTQIRILQDAKQREFDLAKTRIEAEKRDEIRQVEDRLQSEIGGVQTRVQLLAVVLPPIPVFIVGILVFFARVSREKEGVEPSRLV